MFKGRRRVLMCYFILLVWIFLIIAGTYKYMSIREVQPMQNFILTDDANYNFIGTKQLKQIFESCSEFSDIVPKNEGGIYEEFVLKGIIVLTRHGDRGPLNYVNGIESVDCGIKDPMLDAYVQFLTNWTHALWRQLDSFHGFQLLPLGSTSCQLGQLTFKGITQLLKLGKVLHDIYAKHLFLSTTDNGKLLLSPNDILVVSTKYRRTFQSAMALMFNIVPNYIWTHLNIKESFSISFCFTDCACASSNYYQKLLAIEIDKQLQGQPHILKVVKNLRNSLIESKVARVPDLIDALLSFLCHKASLPCKNYSNGYWNNVKMSNQRSLHSTDNKFLNYVINIDQDDKSKDVTAYDDLIDVYSNKYENDKKCISSEHVSMLFNYLYEDKKRQMQSINNNIISILKAYGLIKNIVKGMLGIVSNDSPKFILYSGHDKTLQYLSTALGFGDNIYSIPYASRIIFEIYLKKQFDISNLSNVLPKEYYFRVLYNGQDVTRNLIFCRGNKSLMRVRQDINGHNKQSYFCSIEYIVRYIHEDYFVPLNSTNYKDACTKHS